MLTMLAEAGFLTIPDRESTFPLRHDREQWYCFEDSSLSFFKRGITVAGTVSDSHRIPFYTAVRPIAVSPLPSAKLIISSMILSYL